MSEVIGAAAGLVGIAAVERDTGLSKDILRVWERRYGFPQPLRDAAGDRAYPLEQVQRLRLLKRLLDGGHRPGRIVPASQATLESLLLQTAPVRTAVVGASVPPQTEALDACLQLLRRHQLDELRRHLLQALMRQGLSGFVQQLVAPLTCLVGESWMRGELEVFEEHLYTETVQQVLRQAVLAIPVQEGAGRPRVLLTTLPGEPHGLGLLMVEALLAIEGCQCLFLGVQTPAEELPRAVAAHGSDILALSFSGLIAAGAVRRGLSDLRAALPTQVELWAGGSALRLKHPFKLNGVSVVTELALLPQAVAQWRALRQRA